MTEAFERLSSLPDRCPTWTEVGILLDRLRTARDEIKHLETLLREANRAFDEVTGDYAQEMVAGEAWRTFGADEAGLSGSEVNDGI